MPRFAGLRIVIEVRLIWNCPGESNLISVVHSSQIFRSGILPLMVRAKLSTDLYNDAGVLLESVKVLHKERKLQRAAAYQTLKCYDQSLDKGINKTLSFFKKPAYLTLRLVTEHEVRVEVDMEGDIIIMFVEPEG